MMLKCDENTQTVEAVTRQTLRASSPNHSKYFLSGWLRGCILQSLRFQGLRFKVANLGT